MKSADVHGRMSATTSLGWIITFADLICLLLAFFVMLFSMSSLNDTRTKAAIESVGQAFSAGGPGGRGEAFTGSDGDALAARDLQTRLAEVFATAIPAARVGLVQPSRLMQVEFPTEVLFLPDSGELRSGQSPLLDRLVAALGNPPPGRRIEMEMTIGRSRGPSDALAIARAGAFARGMFGRGLDRGVLRTGLAAGDTDQVRLSFRLLADQPSAGPN